MQIGVQNGPGAALNLAPPARPEATGRGGGERSRLRPTWGLAPSLLHRLTEAAASSTLGLEPAVLVRSEVTLTL